MSIQSTGVDVDQDVQLIPVDELGNALSPVDVTPPTARVVIPVFSDRQSRTLPVNPIVTGTPGGGLRDRLGRRSIRSSCSSRATPISSPA